MSVDLLIRGAQIATECGTFAASIAIDDGVIVSVGDDGVMPSANHVIDASGKFVLPGAIDGHMHVCEDLSVLAEPYETGTQAAAAGGVTTLLLMPWDTPTLETVEILERRKSYATGRSYVDFGFHAGITALDIEDVERNVPALWDAGVTGFKILMVTDDPHFPQLDDGQMVDALRAIASVRGLAVVHAENAAILKRNRERLLAAGRKDPLAYEEYRSALSENEAVRRLLYLAEQVGARVVVAHMSTADGVTRTKEARERGAQTYAEVCPRNLYLSTDDLAQRGSWVKTGPPVRSPSEVAALWRLMGDDSVSVISSDHAAWTKEDRRAGEHDIWVAYDGIPQVQEILPLLLDSVSSGHLSLNDVVRLTSYNPSHIYGLRPRKGLIRPGYDADLVIVDMEQEVTINEQWVKTAVGYSAYEGRTLHGVPTMTLVRGEIVMQDGEIVGSPSHGRFLVRPN